MIFSFITAITIILRNLKLTKKNRIPIVLLYGHKLNGNLKSLYNKLLEEPKQIQVYFLTMDPEYHALLKKKGHQTLNGLTPSTASTLAKANLIVSDHGLHCLVALLHYTDIKFADVWHGIPFKGFDQDDFRVQHHFDEIWVSSELLKKIYIEKFGFCEKIVHVTGYGRTDKLVKGEVNKALKQSIGLPEDHKVILFAPTWVQDDFGRNLYPFGLSEDEFLSRLSDFATTNNCSCLVRHHLNSNSTIADNYPNLYFVPSQEYEDTEDILLISDILICDWSSIAFDYLALNRPTIFLDVPAPFIKGFTLGCDFRFGHIVTSIEHLIESLMNFTNTPAHYFELYSNMHAQTEKRVYEEALDGYSTERYFNRVIKLIMK